jgi:ATP-independent RNA helicase DbpA
MNETSPSFHSLSSLVSSDILSVIGELGFTELTPIQAQSIPPLLAGKDLIGQSKTGSGKTLAFTLPILQNLQLADHTLQALILCPTRELSTQVVREIRKLGRRHLGLQVALLVGGQPLRPQIESLQSGAHIAVGTPGRIVDLIGRRAFDTGGLKTLVLDEADKMLEMGFADELSAIMEALPSRRQTAFFSATLPPLFLELSRSFQKNPTVVKIEDPTDGTHSIDQYAYETETADKLGTLMRILQRHPSQATLIFCNQKATVAQLVETIEAEGVSCAALHGDLEQRDRDRVLAMFRNQSHRILVATDVAARGLDIDHLDLVINYDFPLQPESYVHRIGRTGRAGRKGTAVTLHQKSEILKLFEIEQHTGVKCQKPELGFKNQHGLGTTYRQAAMKTISISGGRKDKLRPGDILGALTGSSGGLKGSEIGKIEIHDKLSYVAVSADVAQRALASLRDGRIKAQKFQVRFMK